ncbi:hypothetical protein ElyMa_005406100 [Elysia marginata]|uniref:Uncharacterized protein n=1 Tax=Elysia marginata TaxID=1093978 RepID=A0AAV4EHW2_9GAST|nr:hypothetical protein ElyMa_005406100 [Elysia marginata]
MDSGSVISSISLAHSFDFPGRSAGSSSGRGRTMVRQRQEHHNSNTNTARPGRAQSEAVVIGATTNIANTYDDSDNDFGSDNEAATHHQHNYIHHHYPLQQRRPRRESVDMFSETISIGGVTDLSAERPGTHDTSHSVHLMRDASILSGQPDKSNFREKLRHWTVQEDPSSPLLVPRPTTSLASQKPTCQILSDVQREMTFLMSRPSTSNFPAKPKELIEPLDGLLPSESPVTQKKFLVLPSIGHSMMRRQRSNLETINQLDYSRQDMEDEADFFAGYHNHAPNHSSKAKTASFSQHSKHKHHRQSKHKKHSSSHHRPHSPTERPEHHTGLHKSGSRSSLVFNNNYSIDPRDSPTKAADTPMPLPPIPKYHPKHPGRRAGFPSAPRPDGSSVVDAAETSSSASGSSQDDRLEEIIYDTDLEEVDEEQEEDLDRFRQRTPETYRTGSPPVPITPPPGFR